MNPLTPEQQKALATLMQLLPELQQALRYIADRKTQQLTPPLDDVSKLAVGAGVYGIGTDTVAVGSIYIDTNRGKFKVLHAGSL